MIYEKSAGVITFRFHPKDGLQYLVLYMRGTYWNFPKGKMIEQENEMKAAKRELFEETGIKKVKLVNGWRQETDFFFKEDRGNGKELIKKNMVLFLAKVSVDTRVDIQNNEAQNEVINGYAWLDYKTACKYLKFKGIKGIMAEADSFIQNKVKQYKEQKTEK